VHLSAVHMIRAWVSKKNRGKTEWPGDIRQTAVIATIVPTDEQIYSLIKRFRKFDAVISG